MRIRSSIRHAIAKAVRSSSLLSGLKRSYDARRKTIAFQNSRQYWEERYNSGGDSGEGSYGQLARYKADFINEFCRDNRAESVIEFGCGDGNQTSLLSIPKYTGVDISKKCIEECRKSLSRRGFEFFVLEDYLKSSPTACNDLALSLDVIYHLVEDSIYKSYIDTLLAASRKHALIYSSNFDHYDKSLPHVRHREFIRDILLWHPEWRIIKKFDNPLAKQHESKEYGSFAQFHLLLRKPV